MSVTALTVHRNLEITDQRSAPSGCYVSSGVGASANHVLVMLSVTLVVLAAISATFTAWSTVIDAQASTALARAFGTTPRQISAALTTAQLLPGLAAACVVIPGTLATVAAATAIPARIRARRSVAEVLRAEWRVFPVLLGPQLRRSGVGNFAAQRIACRR